MFFVHWISIRLPWEPLCLYSQESIPLTWKSSVCSESRDLKEPAGLLIFLRMNLWRKISHLMLNSADPIEKFASLCFIFPSFQQKKLGHRPQAPCRVAPLTCCLNQSWCGVWTETRYPPFEEDTWIPDQPSIPLCRMTRHFKLCSHLGSLYHQASIPVYQYTSFSPVHWDPTFLALVLIHRVRQWRRYPVFRSQWSLLSQS